MKRMVLVAAFVMAACAAQESADVNAQGLIASLAYRADGHLIMLPIDVGAGEPVWFMLDSGASHSVIDPRLSQRLGQTVDWRGSVTGTGQGDIPIGHVGPMTLGVGELALAIEDPWVIDLSGVPIDADVRGLVGAELFKNYVVRLDPDRRMLEVFDPARFSPTEQESSIPLTVEGDRMFIEATLDVRPGLTVQSRMRVDTGSEEFVNDPSVAQSTETRRTVLGNGLGANFEGVSGVFEAVHLGPYTFRRAWGPGGPRASVGMEMFRRFVVTFDAPHGRMYLTPASAFDEPVPPPPA